MADQRRFPPPWRAEPIPGGYVVRDANGQALAYLYSRDNPTEALQAKMLTRATMTKCSQSAQNLNRQHKPLYKGF